MLRSASWRAQEVWSTSRRGLESVGKDMHFSWLCLGIRHALALAQKRLGWEHTGFPDFLLNSWREEQQQQLTFELFYDNCTNGDCLRNTSIK